MAPLGHRLAVHKTGPFLENGSLSSRGTTFFLNRFPKWCPKGTVSVPPFFSALKRGCVKVGVLSDHEVSIPIFQIQHAYPNIPISER